jgi:molybdopterin molybdotransferase
MSLLNLPSFENLPTREEVLDSIFALWKPERPVETVAVEAALGRVLARDYHSLVTLPVVRASGGDGIAVSSKCFSNGIPDTSNWKIGEDFVRADTGDDFDDRFDAVIFIEDVDLTDDGKISIHSDVEVKKGSNVRQAGSTINKGDLLVQKHRPLRPRDLAGLHMGGVLAVEVFKKPVVAFIPTGSELVSPRSQVPRGKNIDTNSVLVQTTLQLLGAEPLLYPIVSDDKTALEQVLDDALQKADLVILNGGSSKGDEDYNARLLHKLGKVLCHGAAAAPGKPLCAAIANNKPVINLPGPFLAAYHGLEWCINALVSHYLCLPPKTRQTLEVTLTEEVRVPKDISILCNFNLGRSKNGEYLATPINFKQGPMGKTVGAIAQYMTPLGGEPLPAGSKITVELLQGIEYIPQL